MSWNDGLEVSSVAYQIASSSEKNIKVLAGPGTGKSFAMKRRVARLLEDGVLPEEILAVTFTRVAAGDLDAELRATGVPGAEQLEAQTLHSFALRVLSGSNAIESSGRTPRLLNEYEMAALYCDFESDFGGKKKVKKLLSRFSDAWGHESTAFFAQLEGEDKEFHTQLMNWLDFHQGMLLEELIFLANSFLKMNPNSEDLTRYKHVLVDEYQDFNQAEQNLVRQLSCDADICIVGDDDQSIYGFKQANPQGIRDWTADAEFPMQECRRCPTDVVGIANSLIAHNKERQGRKLVGMVENGQGDIKYQQFPNFDDEVASIATNVEALISDGYKASDIIILYPRKKLARLIIDALEQKKIPVRSYFAEASLRDKVEVQEKMALLKLFLDNEDRVSLRWLLGRRISKFSPGPYASIRQECEANSISPW